MKYNKINRYNFYNKTGKDYLFISNILNITKTSNEIDHDQFSFNPNEKLKEFTFQMRVDKALRQNSINIKQEASEFFNTLNSEQEKKDWKIHET